MEREETVWREEWQPHRGRFVMEKAMSVLLQPSPNTRNSCAQGGSIHSVPRRVGWGGSCASSLRRNGTRGGRKVGNYDGVMGNNGGGRLRCDNTIMATATKMRRICAASCGSSHGSNFISDRKVCACSSSSSRVANAGLGVEVEDGKLSEEVDVFSNGIKSVTGNGEGVKVGMREVDKRVHVDSLTGDDFDGGIVSFLRGQNILISGATGFLAKLLVEKILYEQPNIGKLYLLIQPRGETTAQQRLEALVDSPVFDRLRDRHGKAFNDLVSTKLIAVAGNVAEEGLGISLEDDSMIKEEITILINSAATTTFDEQYDIALKVNTLGALNCIKYAKACPQLTQVVQISTAFVNGTRRGYTPEKPFYPGDSIARELKGDSAPFLDIDAEISAGLAAVGNAETELRLKGITEEIEFKNCVKSTMKEMGLAKARTHGWQDTYVFTKAMGEMLVSRERGNLPVAVIRPSIVESAWKEPIKGWIEGIRMCDPIIIAYGKGQIDGFCGDPEGCLDVVPADMVTNAILAAMPRLVGRTSLDVYHVATSIANPLSNRAFVDAVTSHFRNTPMKDKRGEDIQVQDMEIFSSVEMYSAALFLRYGAPLYLKKFKESIMPWTAEKGAKRRRDIIIEKTYEQLSYLADIYRPYTFYECRFAAENTKRMFAELHPSDKEKFNFDLQEIDWLEYLSGIHVKGIRQYVLQGRV